jgi:hypothetical protein
MLICQAPLQVQLPLHVVQAVVAPLTVTFHTQKYCCLTVRVFWSSTSTYFTLLQDRTIWAVLDCPSVDSQLHSSTPSLTTREFTKPSNSCRWDCSQRRYSTWDAVQSSLPVLLYCSILLHCIDLTSCFAFMPSGCNIGHYSLIFLYWHYMFRPNRPSSGVQVVVMEESAAHCNAVLLFLCSCLGYVG